MSKIALACLAGLSSLPAFLTTVRAAEDAPLETLIVSATRIATPASQIASTVTVITAEEIAAKQLRTVTDVLKLVPGLNVVQSGGPGAQTSIFLRGTNSNHTKVLIDGIDVADPSNANAAFDFGTLLASDIERIEVLRGPQSGLYGSDAVGGVISITTHGGSGPLSIVGSAEGGSFHTLNEALSVGGSGEQLQVAANVEHLHAGATPVTPLNLLAPGEARNDDYYDNVTASARVGYSVTPMLDFSWTGRFTDAHLGSTGEDYSAFPAVPAAQPSKSDTSQYFTRLGGHWVSFNGTVDQTVGVAYSSAWSVNLDPLAGPSRNTGDRTKIDWQGALHLSSDDTLVLDAEHARDAIHDPISARLSDNAGAVELQSHVWGDLYSALNLRYDDNSRFGSKVTWRVAPTYTLAPSDTRLSASAGTGFKAPTLGELFQNFPPFFFANPHLRPESSTGYDLGIQQGFLGRRIEVGATWYRNNIRDLITSDATFTTYANIGRAVTQGVESFVSWQPLSSLKLRADYTFTQADDEVLHLELLRRPKHKATLDAAWQLSTQLSLDTTVLYIGRWIDGNRDFSIARLTAPAYATLNVAVNYAVLARLTLFARVDNLLDRHYENPVGFLQPALGIFVGLRGELRP